MIYRAFAVVFYLSAAVSIGFAVHAFWSGYPMTLGLGGAVPLLFMLAAGMLAALGNYAWRAARL